MKKKSIGILLRDMKKRLLDDSVPVSSILRMALVLSYETEDFKTSGVGEFRVGWL